MNETTIHVEIPGLQSFIFQTSTLLDSIGRSALVRELTDPCGTLLKGCLDSGKVKLRVRRPGGLTLEAPSVEAARRFVASYSRGVSDAADGLEVVAALTPGPALAPAASLLLKARWHVFRGMGGQPLPGVARCVLTGAGAETHRTTEIGGQDVEQPVATEIKTSRTRGAQAHKALETQLQDILSAPDLPGVSLSLPMDLGALGATADVSSKIAVIVSDVNGLGNQIHQALNLHPGAWEDKAGFQDRLGQLIQGVTEELFKHLVDRVTSHIRHEPGTNPTMGGLPEEMAFDLHPVPGMGAGNHFLPMRPVITGGDDLTVVCESRLAWSVAEDIMAFFDHCPQGSARAALRDASPAFATPEGLLRMTVGIGMAVVPVGYSFRQAHALATGLCHHAKAHRRGEEAQAESHVIDWHLGEADLSTVLAARPEKDHLLAGRPYFRDRGQHNHPATSWRRLLALLDPSVPGSLRDDGPMDGFLPWGKQRSWLKSELPQYLFDAARLQHAYDQRSLRVGSTHHLQMPPITTVAQTAGGGGLEEHQLILQDAIELLDEHLELHTGEAPTP